MSNSTLIHSSLVNPAQPSNIKQMQHQQDHVTLDMPLLIKLFELVREQVKTPADVTNLVERILSIKQLGVLSMDQYQQIAHDDTRPHSSTEPNPELESILNLAGIK